MCPLIRNLTTRRAGPPAGSVTHTNHICMGIVPVPSLVGAHPKPQTSTIGEEWTDRCRECKEVRRSRAGARANSS